MKKKFLYVLLALVLSFSYCFICYAVENLEDDWTEYDTGDDINVSGGGVAYGLEQDDDCRLYRDFGVDYFSGSFQIDFDLKILTSVPSSACGMMQISNTIGTQWEHMNDPKYAGLSLQVVNPSIPDEVHIALIEIESDLTKHDSSGGASFFVAVEGVQYYCTFERNEDIGSYGEVRLKSFLDVERTINVSEFSMILHEKQDFRYVHAITGYGSATGGYSFIGEMGNISIWNYGGDVPNPYTYPEYDLGGEAVLQGYVQNDDESVIDSGFDVGLSSGNYTWEYTGLTLSDTDIFTYETDNYTIGETYYFRAKAENEYGWGYGLERSFQWSGGLAFAFTTGTATVTQGETGNSSAVFSTFQEPLVSTNVTAYLSTAYPLWVDSENMTLIYAAGGEFVFSTGNTTDIDSGYVLLPDTKYYYRGFLIYAGRGYFSPIRSFITGNVSTGIPDFPLIWIDSVEDVSTSYDVKYVIKATATITYPTENTSRVYEQGFRFSLSKSIGNSLLPPIHEYRVDRVIDSTDILSIGEYWQGTYSQAYWLGNTDWYQGEVLYFQAYIIDDYYDTIYSSLVTFDPSKTSDSGVDGTGVPELINDMLKGVRYRLGLTGVMGTWAFMFLILVLIAVIFAPIMFTQKDNDTAKTAIGIIWAILSMCVVGAFIFTGELGIFPVLILVGALVLAIIIIGGRKLSGGET